MRLYFHEQDVIDSVCVYVARQHGCSPVEIEADLQFHPERGFAAEAKKEFHTVLLHEQALIDAIALYLAEYHQFMPERLKIDLLYNQQTGVEAEIVVE